MGAQDSTPAPVPDVVLARLALAATRAIPGVAGISRGRYALARTFGLGGETVDGVQLTHGADGLRVEVHLVVRLVPIPPLAEAVRAVIATTAAGMGTPVAAVDVWVDELHVDDVEGEEGAG